MTLSEGIIKLNSKALDLADLKRLDKLEKEAIANVALNNKDIRVQLNDQLKCLDNRLELQQAIVAEVQDLFRRRAEIELNYSKELEKLSKYISNRNKDNKQKRDGWQLFSSTGVWDQLLAQTRRASRDHGALADIYSCHVVQRCNGIGEDLQRMYRKCREIGYEIHEEVLKVLHELHTTMKTYHAYQSEFRQAENKLHNVERQRNKLHQTVPVEKREKHKKFRIIEKEYLKRKQKFDDARLNATKARNEYLLSMDAANASIQKYFVDDLSDLIDCMDFGFHQSLNRAVMMHSSAMDQVRRSLQVDIDNMNKSLAGLDSRLDKQRFFEFNNAAFMIPKKFEYNPVRRDETETLVQKGILDELEFRRNKLKERLTTLRTESEEIWKSMETAERTLSDMVGANDYDTTRFFVEDDRSAHREPESILQKQKSDRIDIETFYTDKFRDYVLNSNRMSRLQAKFDHIRVTLGDQASVPIDGNTTLSRRSNASRRRRIGRSRQHHGGQPKLFGGSLEEYLEETNQDIPTIIKSCVRVINLYGLHHHGIFRVSGSQVEINNFRDAFERGDDPLADMTDASDINSVAGVLKLYLRELREPLFPIQYFDQFMELAQLESKHEFVVKVRDLVKAWPRPIFIVMRYLFSFLNHLSEFSDENMMDPYNLAICFGPTLVPIPEERDQVQFQNLVNELIKNFIIFHEDIFPSSVAGPLYEKYFTCIEPDDMGDSPVENSQDDLESEVAEDDSVFRESADREEFSLDIFGKSEVLEAQALYDFSARSAREVNFSKGDIVILYKQVSNDWWKGSVNGREGLIPDKYIMLRMRGEDERERSESCRSMEDSGIRDGSEASSRCRASSSSENRFSQPSPSPVARRRSRPSSSSGATPSGSQVGSTSSTLSSPGSARTSRTSVSSHRKLSVRSAAVAPASPPSSTTVIAVPGQRPILDSGPGSPTHRPSTPDTQDRMSSNTHIIKVSGPVTKLDETVTSAALSVSPLFHRDTKAAEALGPRSRLPVSPSFETRLDQEDLAAVHHERRASQDSIESTGSNRELKSRLDSTLAEVEALAQHLESQKFAQHGRLLPVSDTTSRSPSPSEKPADVPKPTHRQSLTRTTSTDDSSDQQAGRPPVATPRTTPPATSANSPQDEIAAPPPPKVLLKQSSWASREHVDRAPVEGAAAATAGDSTKMLGKSGAFAKNRSLWERRSSQPTERVEAPDNALRPGFRSNRDFWEQRVCLRNKQTPDLVLDLPVTASATPLPSSGKASASSSSSLPAVATAMATVAPTPKPRPRASVELTSNEESNVSDPLAKTLRSSDRSACKPGDAAATTQNGDHSPE